MRKPRKCTGFALIVIYILVFMMADPVEGQKGEDLKAMEIQSDYAEGCYQHGCCQHCNHAPARRCAPVVATNHSSEGLNKMAYTVGRYSLLRKTTSIYSKGAFLTGWNTLLINFC